MSFLLLKCGLLTPDCLSPVQLGMDHRYENVADGSHRLERDRAGCKAAVGRKKEVVLVFRIIVFASSAAFLNSTPLETRLFSLNLASI
jgi:hypothetical protein